MNILVIDDSRCQRKLIVAMIEDIGFKALPFTLMSDAQCKAE